MAVSYPLTMPASPAIRRARIELVSNNAIFQGPINKVAQTLERDGALWRAMFTLPAMTRAGGAGEWQAFLAALRGPVGTFYGYDPLAVAPRGTAPGTPLVSGASQTGNTLDTKGWTAGQSGILLAGDYIQVGTRFHMVVETAASDGSGLSTLSIEPKLREAPAADAPIVTAAPKIIMRLEGNTAGWNELAGQLYDGFAFAAVEVL